MAIRSGVAPAAHQATGPSRSLLWVTIALIVLAVVAMVVVILGGRSGPATYPAGSPEAAFQAYLAAYEGADPAAAYAALSTRIREAWPYDDYVQARDSYRSWQQDQRVWIDRSERAGEQATLFLTIETRYGSGIGANTSTDHREVRMTLEDGSWRVDQRLVGVENY
jgi:hypothetical protein